MSSKTYDLCEQIAEDMSSDGLTLSVSTVWLEHTLPNLLYKYLPRYAETLHFRVLADVHDANG